MSVHIELDLPEAAFSSLRTTPERFVRELRLAAATKWYEMGLLSQSKGAEVAGVSRQEFVEALGRFGVSTVQSSPKEIEAGVDILDPIQVTAKDMEPHGLVEKFGGKIVFHGGVDTQQVLPKGTPAEVAAHSKHVLQALSAKNGYIFAPSQILGPDIPVENILAMYGVVGSCCGYRKTN